MFLTRARLRTDRGLQAIAPLLMPSGEDARADADHRLVWMLFADAPGRRRDFLWRKEAPGTFLLLSERPPRDPAALFDLDPPKEFAPALRVGDRLGFLLRANAVVSRSAAPGARGRRRDVVADAMRAVPLEERAARRRVVIAEAGRAWLAQQGAGHGFTLAGGLAVEGDEWRRIPRLSAKPITFNVLDFAGVLGVSDPAAFLGGVCSGFGRARAFGCGLMLIRRA
jgi:CRISPR system Cascade subunit CasE